MQMLSTKTLCNGQIASDFLVSFDFVSETHPFASISIHFIWQITQLPFAQDFAARRTGS
jgi:hypothetical protein